ncbi:MAG: hypothetical protein PUK66_07285 [Bacteroidales bacterium]|uniref:hypothetical protein n=1 Tax=Porphyromonas sp. TaxID=1924944 RepID=UPI002975D346|nr:hypothetical protein [Porphyromonas sp.]MDD7438615.1 hypothetical protein [Bacteroidales bacterium]MDY3067871.1 hypothetical protein [Porphyromonas sp.]
MQIYTSRPIELKKDIDTIFGMVENPHNMEPLLEKYRDKLDDNVKVELVGDQISLTLPMVGNVIMKRTEVVAPNRVKYETIKSPVPVALVFSLSKHEASHTLGQISVEVNMPPFLSGMVKGKVEPGLDKIANLLEQIDFDRLIKGTSLEK